MNAQKFFRLNLLSLLALVIMMASCSKDSSELMGFVPKDADVVATLKPMDLAKKANLKELKVSNPSLTKLKDLFLADNGIDLRQTVFFQMGDEGCFIFAIKDKGKFEKAFEGISKDEINGKPAYPEMNLIVADDYGWMVADGDMAAVAGKIDGWMTQTEENSIQAVKGFSDMMLKSDVDVYVNFGKIYGMAPASERSILSNIPAYQKLKDASLYINLSFEKEDVFLKFHALNTEGKNMLPEMGLKDIDKSVFKYIDEKSSFVTAQAANQEMVDSYKAMMAQTLVVPSEKQMADVLLNSWDGSLAVGITVSDLDNYMANSGSLVLGLTENGEENLNKMFKNEMVTMGLLTETGKNTYTANNRPLPSPLTLKIVDNKLVVNYGAEVKDSYSASKFSGKSSGVYIDCSEGTPLAQFLQGALGNKPVSGYVYGYMDEEEGSLQIHVNDAGGEHENVMSLLVDLMSLAL